MLLSVSVIDFPFRGLALWVTCVWHWFSWFFWGMIDFLSELHQFIAIPTVKWMPTGIIDYRKPECLDRLKFQDAIIHVLFCFFVFFFLCALWHPCKICSSVMHQPRKSLWHRSTSVLSVCVFLFGIVLLHLTLLRTVNEVAHLIWRAVPFHIYLVLINLLSLPSV